MKDSLLTVLQNDTVKMVPRLLKSLHAQKTQAIGCFAKARVMMFVAQWAGDYEYYHQLAVLVDTTGKLTPIRVSDLRFKVHEPLGVLDADGDGVDDIALRGRANRIGGTVILQAGSGEAAAGLHGGRIRVGELLRRRAVRYG